MKKKYGFRHGIEEEITRMLNSSSSSSPFLVHCLQPNNTLIENVSLKNIIKLFPETTPVLAIINCRNKVKATCFVPKVASYYKKLLINLFYTVRNQPFF